MKNSKIDYIKQKDNLPDLDSEQWLEPSDKVWKKVSETIPKKRRSRFIPIFLIFALMLFGLGYSLNSNWNNSNKTTGKNYLEIHSKNNKAAKDQDCKEEVLPIKSTSINSYNTNNLIAIETISNSTEKLNSKKSKNEKIINKYIKDPHNPKNLINKPEFYNSSYSLSLEQNNANINQNLVTSKSYKYDDATFGALPNKVDYLVYQKEIQNSSIPFSPGVIKIKPINTVLLGLNISYDPFTLRNEIKRNIPIDETIVNSKYKNEINFGLSLEKNFQKNYFLAFNPTLSIDNLITTYSLDIPYDYNTETINTNSKENTFKHSLPTDLGNINTTLVVQRASNSPVEHNEIVNYDFVARYRSISISLPISLNYKFSNNFYSGFVLNSEFNVANQLITDHIKSNHTYVSAKSMSISNDTHNSGISFSIGARSGYRNRLTRNSIFDLNLSYFNYLSQGRSQNIFIGSGIYWQF